jgi:hypothetical protein
VKKRLKDAEYDHAQRFKKEKKVMAHKVKVDVGSGNIFADRGLPDADTHFLKAQIVSEIYRISKRVQLKCVISWQIN